MKITQKHRRFESGHQIECLFLSSVVAMAIGLSAGIGARLAKLGYASHTLLGILAVLSGMVVASGLIGLIGASVASLRAKEETFLTWWKIASAWAFITIQPVLILCIILRAVLR